MSAMPVLAIALLACLVPVAILAGGAVIGLVHLGRSLLPRADAPPRTQRPAA